MELAKQAVEHDTAGRLVEAVPLYERAAQLILASSPDETERCGSLLTRQPAHPSPVGAPYVTLSRASAAWNPAPGRDGRLLGLCV
jgi:hypothetical protein